MWLDTYVTDAGWTQFLNNVRQQRFKHANRYERTSFKVTSKIGYRLRTWAEERNLTIDGALARLLDEHTKLTERQVSQAARVTQVQERDRKKAS